MNGPATALGTFILIILADWLALTAIINWLDPKFWNEDGKVNWWTTLWVALLLVILAGIIMAIIGWIFFSNMNNNGLQSNKCPPPPQKDNCGPCQPAKIAC